MTPLPISRSTGASPHRVRFAKALLAAAVLGAVLATASAGAPLRVVATVPDLGDLARQVGGDLVGVQVLTKGPQDPHFLEPRPSFIRLLHDADALLLVGLDLEVGWLPVLLQGARNSRIQLGQKGYVDASQAIAPLEVPVGNVDRSMGDVHPFGNPHYLLDPVNGLRVARLLRDRFASLRPGEAGAFASGYQAFAKRLVERLVGPELAGRHDPEALAAAIEAGTLASLLATDGGTTAVGGWLAAARPLQGTLVVEDHKLWSYFVRRFGIVAVETLEPKPGIAPTTRHLGEVVERVRARQVPVILASPYFDVRHARWVAERTGARVATMAHQVGSRDGADDYLATVDYNLRQVTEAKGG
jgi:ABC-type Zn uptake system ZnuABC Zn-binding protein ZnuA